MTGLMEKEERVPNTAPGDAERDEGFLSLLLPLHAIFTPRQREFVAARHRVLERAHRGVQPTHPAASDVTDGAWRIELPDWCRDQRNQMTGPADDAELVVKMLNSGAPGVMLDLEDSMANTWANLAQGIDNVVNALHGTLTYEDRKRNRTVAIDESPTVIFTRARGLHLDQAGVIEGGMVSASLFDVASIVHRVDPERLKQPLCFYIPKSESAGEAAWWADLFRELEKAKGLPPKSIKCMALVESHPLAHEMEEFIYHLRDSILGLNLGRWDYMASLAHFNLQDPAWVLPDRNTIPHDVPFFQNLRRLLPEICHKRGILAIGGMTALYPSRVDAELNGRALDALGKDKKNEADCLMDGAWTGHPDQNGIAVSCFPEPNQAGKRRPNEERYPDLRPRPVGVGRVTLEGTRAAIRTVIRYRFGVLGGKGASLLDGYMEDLATDRIYRLMIAQRTLHRVKVDGVEHTPERITGLFDEELERLLAALPENTDPTIRTRYRSARKLSERMIVKGEFDPV